MNNSNNENMALENPIVVKDLRALCIQEHKLKPSPEKDGKNKGELNVQKLGKL